MIKYNIKLINNEGLTNTINYLQNGNVKREGIKISVLYTKYNDTQPVECMILNNKQSDIDKIKYIIVGINSVLKSYTRLYLLDSSGEVIKTLIG